MWDQEVIKNTWLLSGWLDCFWYAHPSLLRGQVLCSWKQLQPWDSIWGLHSCMAVCSSLNLSLQVGHLLEQLALATLQLVAGQGSHWGAGGVRELKAALKSHLKEYLNVLFTFRVEYAYFNWEYQRKEFCSIRLGLARQMRQNRWESWAEVVKQLCGSKRQSDQRKIGVV